jgi:hypothetical protein
MPLVTLNLRSNKIANSVQILDLNGAFVVYLDLTLVDRLALGFTAFLVATFLALGFPVALTAVLVAGLAVAACAAGIPAVSAMPENRALRARAVARTDLPNLKFMVYDSA